MIAFRHGRNEPSGVTAEGKCVAGAGKGVRANGQKGGRPLGAKDGVQEKGLCPRKTGKSLCKPSWAKHTKNE